MPPYAGTAIRLKKEGSMLNTPEEKLEHLFDEFVWAWYLTCLPTDRRKRRAVLPPPLVHDLLTSRRIAELILTRYDEAFASKRIDLRSLAHQYRDSRKYAARDMSHSLSRFTLCGGDVTQIKNELFQFQLRALLLPQSIEAMQEELRHQVSWMYAYFTPSERVFLDEIAVWHTEQEASALSGEPPRNA